MKTILHFIMLFICVRMGFFIRGLSLINQHKCYGYFGVPGSGKTTKLTQLVYRVSKKRPVYVNWSVAKLPGHDIRYYDPFQFRSGSWFPDDGSALFIDEISTIFDPRQFKSNFTPITRRWWAEHRHHRVAIYYGCQSYEGADKVIRELTDSLMICKRSMSVFVKTREIIKSIDIVNGAAGDGKQQGGGQIVDKYAYFPIPGFLYLPKWIKRFNSYELHGVEDYRDIELQNFKQTLSRNLMKIRIFFRKFVSEEGWRRKPQLFRKRSKH